MKEKEFYETMTGNLKTETFVNERKRLYNREKGREAVVNQVCITFIHSARKGVVL